MLYRVLNALTHLAVGLIFGALMTFGHQASSEVAGVELPWGIVLSCLGVAALLVGYRLLAGTREPAIWAGLGMVLAVVLLSLPGPGGSVLIPAGTVGVIWSLAPTIIAVIVIGWPTQIRRSNTRGASGSGSAAA